MGYKDFMSKTEDIVWLAYQLKDKLGSKISINKVGLYKEYLEGRYNLDTSGRGVNFCILYSDKEFLRVEVGEFGAYASTYEDKVLVLNELKNAISCISRNGVSLGEPSIFYNVRNEKYIIPHLEYIYADKENAIKEFQDKTIFDDGSVPENVILFDYLQDGKDVWVVEDYSFDDKDDKYIMKISATLKNKSNVTNKMLKTLLIENLDNLCYGYYQHDSNCLLSKYANCECNMSYVVAAIKEALSLTEETELLITMIKNDDVKHYVYYKDDILVQYNSNVKDGMLEMETFYKYDQGMYFKTNCGVKKGYEFVQKHVCEETDIINELVNGNDKYMGKSNNNLLKLVRRIGNK